MELAIFGGVAAGVTLGAELMKLGRKLHRLVKSVRYARKDLQKLVDEIHIFYGLLDDFCAGFKPESSSRSISVEHLVTWSEDVIKGIKVLLVKVEGISGSASNDILQTTKAHIEWFLSKSSVKCLKASLSVARESINVYLNLRILENLEKELRRREREEQPNWEAIEEIKKRIRTRRESSRYVKKCLQKSIDKVTEYQKDSKTPDILPDHETLLDFTDSIQDYGDKVLPPRRSTNSHRPASRNLPPSSPLPPGPPLPPSPPSSHHRTRNQTIQIQRDIYPSQASHQKIIPIMRRTPSGTLRRQNVSMPRGFFHSTPTVSSQSSLPPTTPPTYPGLVPEVHSIPTASSSTSNLSSLSGSSTDAMIDGHQPLSPPHIKQRTLLRPISPLHSPKSSSSSSSSSSEACHIHPKPKCKPRPKPLEIKKTDTTIKTSPSDTESLDANRSRRRAERARMNRARIGGERVEFVPEERGEENVSELDTTSDEEVSRETQSGNGNGDEDQGPSVWQPLTGRSGKCPPSLRDQYKRKDTDMDGQ